MAACKYDSMARRYRGGLSPRIAWRNPTAPPENETSPAGQSDAATSASETVEIAAEVRHAGKSRLHLTGPASVATIASPTGWTWETIHGIASSSCHSRTTYSLLKVGSETRWNPGPTRAQEGGCRGALAVWNNWGWDSPKASPLKIAANSRPPRSVLRHWPRCDQHHRHRRHHRLPKSQWRMPRVPASYPHVPQTT